MSSPFPFLSSSEPFSIWSLSAKVTDAVAFFEINSLVQDFEKWGQSSFGNLAFGLLLALAIYKIVQTRSFLNRRSALFLSSAFAVLCALLSFLQLNKTWDGLSVVGPLSLATVALVGLLLAMACAFVSLRPLSWQHIREWFSLKLEILGANLLAQAGSRSIDNPARQNLQLSLLEQPDQPLPSSSHRPKKTKDQPANSEAMSRTESKTEKQLQETLDALAKEQCILKSIVSGTSDMIAAVDTELRFTFFNEAYRGAFQTTFGKTPKVGESLIQVLEHTPEQRDLAVQMWSRAVKGEEFGLTHEFGVDENSKKHFDITFNPIRDNQGKITGAAHIVRNATNRVLTERALATAKDSAEKANQSKSLFLANVSHELRTPIGIMLGYAETICDHYSGESDANKAAKHILKNGENLLSLVSDLLDLSRVESGHVELEKNSVHLSTFFDDLISQFRILCSAKSLDIQWRPESRIPEYIVIDKMRLQQIVSNLLNNAVKFTDQGHITVKVDCRKNSPSQEDPYLLHIKVIDTGIGIARSHWDNLFRSFYRIHNPKRNYAGTGLGLSLSRRLAKKMGGNVQLVTSEINHGSTFQISLPISARHLDFQRSSACLGQPIDPYSSNGKNFSPRKPLQNCRILVVEDLPDNRQLMVSFLTRRGAEVETAHNGREAVRKLIKESRRDDFDVVLMDIQMPVMDGHRATRILRRLRYSRPIIAVTAHAMKHEKLLCNQNGFNDFLTKPVDRRTLTEVIIEQSEKALTADRLFSKIPGHGYSTC